MKVYLAGGMKSDWQDKVTEAVPWHTYYDPRSHGLKDPSDYTAWDLEHIDKAGVVFACFTHCNPFGIGMCVEIGYAKNARKHIVLVDEKGLSTWEMVRQCCNYVYPTLDEGISLLKEME